MKMKKLIAFFLAIALAASSLPEFPGLALHSEAAPTKGEDIKLTFTDGDNKDPNTATVLTGGNTHMLVTKSSGFTENPAQPFIILDKDNHAPAAGTIKIEQLEQENRRAISVSEAYAATLGDDRKETFSITGNYYALEAEGDCYETASGGGINMLSKVESNTKNAIMGYSEATIVCVSPETEGNAPQFVFVPGASMTGSFEAFQGGNISVKSSTKDYKKQKIVVLQFSKGANVIEFNLYPQQIYINYDNSSGTPVEISRDNYIRVGTSFRLVFRPPVSNSLFLNVMTPKYATKQIVSEIQGNDGVRVKSFMEFAAGDSQYFITKSFKLKAFSHQFNADFDINWIWTPTYETGDTDEVKKNKDGAVVIATSGDEWRNVAIYPMEEDVKGTLTATVAYRDRIVDSTKPVIQTKTQQIGILIRGTGKPASLSQYSQTIGKVETRFDADHAELPSQKEMDVYDGSVLNYTEPTKPCVYELKMNMGQKNASSQYAIVTASGDADAVSTMTTIVGTTSNYKMGDKINNPKVNAPDEVGEVIFRIMAKQAGTVTLNVKFYVKGNNGKIEEAAVQPKPIRIVVSNSSPKDDATLEMLSIRDPNSPTTEILTGFSPGIREYDVVVPYKTQSVTFRAKTTPGSLARGMIDAFAYYWDNANNKIPVPPFDRETTDTVQGTQIENDVRGSEMQLKPNQPVRVEFTVTAQNPNAKLTYAVNITRGQPSDDATLKSLALYTREDANLKTNLIKGFDPLTKVYTLEVPYSTKMLRVRAEANHPGAKVEFSPPLGKEGVFGANEWLDLTGMTPDSDGIVTFTTTVTPEIGINDGKFQQKYTVQIRREDPNDDSSLKDLKVFDKDDKALKFTPNFNSKQLSYNLQLPYSTDKIKLQATATDPNVSRIEVWTKTDKILDLQNGSISSAVDVDYITADKPYQEFKIKVYAENEAEKYCTSYILQVERAEPSDDALLKSLLINDQDGKAVKGYAFHPEETGYNLTVPYETEKVSFTPTTNHVGATVTIAQKPLAIMTTPVPSGTQSKLFHLNYSFLSKDTEFEIVVTPEDGIAAHRKVYHVRITRSDPSDDARLKGLSVTGIDEFTPLFISNKYQYKAVVTMGAKGVVITATANNRYATIKINGEPWESGKASDLIELIDIQQTIPIEVTAQDGTTKLTYYIEFTNENLIEKSDNADLKMLEVNYGQMTPNFKPSITNYEVAATEDTYSVDILPRPADKNAEVAVFQGTREIGDHNGNFSQAIDDGETSFTIKVTSSDKTTTKNYVVNVYRNEEDMMKNLTPLSADDIDFDNTDDVIIVRIDEYPRVSADVFNKLKEYPEKKIIFQGNDYSLQFNASDIKRIIPQTEIYDFRMSFTSPDEDNIWDAIEDYGRNSDITGRITMIYFEHHGSLPAPATLSLSLGRRYRDNTLYWHYYNKERDRIDYYGMLQTNSQGTFSVKIDHFSTYVVSTRHRIYGAEEKTKPDAVNQAENQYLNTGDKINVNTGVAMGD